MTENRNPSRDETVTTTDESTVQLLIADEGNRRAVAELLQGHYDVDTAPSVRDADLYLVDDRSFPRYHEDLHEQVTASHPEFCPVVLIRHENASVDVSLRSPEEREEPLLVDDIVDAPIERNLLFRRLDTLLVRRDQSRKLMDQISKLEERERELTEKNARLERFASVLSHDLQNPLSVISGFAELITETGETAHAERITAATQRMETILEDLLILAREGNDVGQVENVDITDLAKTAEGSVDTKQASIDIADVGTVEADYGRLRQVFENLFRNAVEHAGADVSLRIEPIEGGFAIEDDGPGISEEMREKVFEEGYTGGGGTGLGLSIVETVVEAHGWEVAVTEGTDGGSRFEITGVEYVEE